MKSLSHKLPTAFLLGLASVAAFAPLGWFPLIWLTLGGLYFLLKKSVGEARQTLHGALTGWAFGFGLFVGGVSWIYVSLSNFGGLPAPLAALSTLLFCAFLGLYPALVGGLFVRFAPMSDGQRSLFFAALWTLGEWLRGWLLTGFPWLAVGYSQAASSPLDGFAAVLGIYGVSLLTTLFATQLTCAAERCTGQSACAIDKRLG